MYNAITKLRLSLERAHNLGGLHKAMALLTTEAIDTSDLLRAQVVMTVSALDFYVHEITRVGMIEIFNGVRPITPGFHKFKISLGASMNGYSGASGWLETEIRERHSFLSFQLPDKIADAIRLFSDIALWDTIAINLSAPAKEIKDRVELIVQRRNKIAHEADINPSYPDGARWPISIQDATATTDFIKSVCEAIHKCVDMNPTVS